MSTTEPPTCSWPSRNTVARTGITSPTTALAGQRPPSMTGNTSTTGIRPIGAGGAGAGAGPSGGKNEVLTPRTYRSKPDSSSVAARILLPRPPSTLSPVKAIRRFTVRPVLPEALASLHPLAVNLRWSWHVPTRELFASIDTELWAAAGHDPVKLLGRLSSKKLDALARDVSFVARVGRHAQDLEAYLSGPRWYQGEQRRRESAGEAALPASIAYFSAEFGITGALPQYSGGLGILAGDHLKSASDLGAPIPGVGLLYGAGYFRQSLPLTLLREDDGAPALVRLALPGGRVLAAQIWRADVGRVPLLLLDSAVMENDDAARRVTDRLYGGASEHRLQQELLLGMGGVKALRVFSRLTGAPAPEVYHCNEGHAGFLGVERIREHI